MILRPKAASHTVSTPKAASDPAPVASGSALAEGDIPVMYGDSIEGDAPKMMVIRSKAKAPKTSPYMRPSFPPLPHRSSAAHAVSLAERERTPRPSSDNDVGGSAEDSKYACVTVVFGDKPAYFLEACVMGYSLRRKTKHDMVLLYTKEVPFVWRAAFQTIGWKIHEVDHIEYKKELCTHIDRRFAHVFTKLNALSLVSYHKVILLDTDLLIRHSIDDLFMRQAPAAVRRHAMGKYVDFTEIDGTDFFRDGSLQGGINAGVVLLEPSAKVLETMKCQLKTGAVPGGVVFNAGPEQDYLTLFYMADWKTLGIEWNFQLHQISFCARPHYEYSPRMTMDYEKDVHIVHYSGATTPAHWVIDPSFNMMDYKDFVEHEILGSFIKRLKDHATTDKEQTEWVEARLREITLVATQQWLEQYTEMAKEHTWILGTVDDQRRAAPQRHQAREVQNDARAKLKRDEKQLRVKHTSQKKPPTPPWRRRDT